MLKNIFIVSAIVFGFIAFGQTAITKVYTDFNGFYESGATSAVRPNNNHNLLGFVWKNKTYSTGVNNSILSSKGVAFESNNFKAFSSFFSQTSLSANTFIGVGEQFGGSGNVSPVPVQNNLTKYLIDGINGLDLGTGIFNFPQSGQINFEIVSIDPNSINDGIPDVVITQIGDPSGNATADEYYFVDNNNNIVGNKYLVTFSNVPSVGIASWKFYDTNVDPPKYNPNVSTNPARDLRLVALDWSELGLTRENQSRVVKLVQVFSGTSDTAFTAYNTKSINLKTSINGVVYNDNNAGTPDGNGFQNATLTLKNKSTGITVATTTTGVNGSYAFTNVSSGEYTVNLTTPAGFFIVGNAEGTTINTLTVTVDSNPVTDRDFGINQPPVAKDDIISAQFNTTAIVNILSNDNDPNNGILISSTINLIPPANAQNIVTVNGRIKGFKISGQGTWSVDNIGLFTFAPATGFSGNATETRYTVRDNADLLSNEAKILIKVETFCYKPAAKTGTNLPTTQGITALGRAGVNQDNWPMVRNGAWTALESKTKGFVVNRIPTTAALTALANPIEGMLAYDVEAKCLKMYTTTDNGATFSWKCLNTQTCPD